MWLYFRYTRAGHDVDVEATGSLGYRGYHRVDVEPDDDDMRALEDDHHPLLDVDAYL
jgi:hypothetical protein